MFKSLATACAFLLFCGAMAGCMHERVVVQNSGQADGLAVSGTGEATAAPDIARVNLGVEARASVAEEASNQVATKMRAAIAALQQAGVAAADIQTSQLSIYFERNPGPPMPVGGEGEAAAERPAQVMPAEPQGQYVVSNMVRVTVRNLDSAEAVVQAATSAGVNQMYGIQFELEHPEALQAEARKLAVADAKKNAQQLAELMGVTLGPLVSVREGGGQAVSRGGMMRAEMAKSSMPVERGELTTQHSVEVVYALQ